MVCIVYSEGPAYLEITKERDLFYKHLECCIKCDPVLSEYVIGVFASDTLPRQPMNQQYGLIVYTDSSSSPGRHWCAIYNDEYGHMEFFDSYGRNPKENTVYISQWIHQRAVTLNMNKKQLQSNHSTVCGLIVFYIYIKG